MKKLMVIAAVALAAVAANAASTSWKITGGGLKGCDLTSTYASKTIEIWASGGDLEEAEMIGSYDSTSTGSMSSTFSTDLLTADVTYNIVYKLSDSKSGVEYTLTSASKSVKAVATGSATVNFQNQSSYTSTAANWVAAPEPTSGLLLLLGMAGLALKRKRA